MIPGEETRLLLEELVSAEVDFILIGGVAMVLHGSAHMTEDIDLYYRRSADNYERLVLALKEYHPRLRGAPDDLPFQWDPLTIRHGQNFTLITDLGAVDLLSDIGQGVSYSELAGRAEAKLCEGVAVQVVSLEDLIELKKLAGRPKDRLHLIDLTALLEARRSERS